MRPILLVLRLPFGLGEFRLWSYPTLLATSAAAGCTWGAVALSSGPKPPALWQALVATFGIMVVAVVGSRGLYGAVNRLSRPAPQRRQRTGAVAWGGLLAAFPAGLLAAAWLGVPFAQLADVSAPAVALGLAVTRIGCFLHGCDYGRPVREDAWAPAVRFPNWNLRYPGLPLAGSLAFWDHCSGGRCRMTEAWSLPVHPTQIYESAFGWLSFGALLWLDSSDLLAPGGLLWSFLASYSAFRVGVEFLRGDATRGRWRGLSTSQWISLAVLPPALVGVALAV